MSDALETETIHKLAGWICTELEKEKDRNPKHSFEVLFRCDNNYREITYRLGCDRIGFMLLKLNDGKIEVQRFDGQQRTLVLSQSFIDKFNPKGRMVDVWCLEGEFEIADPTSFDKILEIAKKQYKRRARIEQEDKNEN
jgi:hypothetical protein